MSIISIDVSSLLLLVVSALTSASSSESPTRELISSLPYDPAFISATSTYLSHVDTSIRRCGMLVGEEIIKYARACEGKKENEGVKLEFGGWEIDDDAKGREPEMLRWCKALRELIHSGQDAHADELSFPDVEAYNSSTNISPSSPNTGKESPRQPTLISSIDSDDEYPPKTSAPDSDDDSLIGYSTHSRPQSPSGSASASPSSSRSPSPTPSLMKQFETEPTLFVGSTNKGKKGRAPVYLLDLVTVLRDPGPTSNASSSSMVISRVGGDEGKESVSDYVDRLEAALRGAEGLIRRKVGYGTELGASCSTFTY